MANISVLAVSNPATSVRSVLGSPVDFVREIETPALGAVGDLSVVLMSIIIFRESVKAFLNSRS